MIDTTSIVQLFEGLMVQLLSWMVGVLPSSPFANISITATAVPNWIGWLNWLVPVTECLQLYAGWLTCAAAWQVVQFVGTKITYVQGVSSTTPELPEGE